MSTEAKDLFGKKLPTGDEIVNELKKQQEKINKEFMYPYITGALTAHYNNLLMQIEIMQSNAKSKNTKQ